MKHQIEELNVALNAPTFIPIITVETPPFCVEGVSLANHEFQNLHYLSGTLKALVGRKIEAVEWVNELHEKKNPDGNIGFFRITVS